METIAKTNEKAPFSWDQLGDIKVGRENLGEEMPVIVYRLMQYTLLEILKNKHGEENAHDSFFKAGHLAGVEFAKNALNLKLDFDGFVSNIQETLKALKIGIFRIEYSDLETGEIVLTIAEDLDCSGLPVTNENVCVYDEGFLAGILETYTGKKYKVEEVDCWASGARVCRFQGRPAS